MKRFISLLVAAIMVVVLLAGCGGKNSDSGNQPETKSSDSSSDNKDSGDAGSKEAKKGPSGKVVVQSWNFACGTFTGETDAAKSAKKFEEYFESFYPDIDAEFSMVQYTDHFNKLKVDFAAGEGPDVIGIQAGAPMTEFKPFLSPLAEYAERDWGSGWKDKFVSGAFTQIDEVGAEIFGMPIIMSYAGQMWYAQSILDKYGLKPPANWDELKSVTGTLRENGELPLVTGAKDSWINLDIFLVIAADINREKIYSAIEGKTPWTDPDIVKAFEHWQKLFTENIYQDGALGLNMYMEAYSIWNDDKGNCKAPLHTNGSWDMGNLIKSNPNYETLKTYNKDAALFPDINGDGKPSPMLSTPDVIFSTTTVSQNPEAAWTFIRWVSGEEGQQACTDGLSGFPAMKGFSPSIEMTPELKNTYGKYMDWAKDSVAGYREIPYPELKQSLAETLQLLAASGATPEEAAKKVETVSQAQER